MSAWNGFVDCAYSIHTPFYRLRTDIGARQQHSSSLPTLARRIIHTTGMSPFSPCPVEHVLTQWVA